MINELLFAGLLEYFVGTGLGDFCAGRDSSALQDSCAVRDTCAVVDTAHAEGGALTSNIKNPIFPETELTTGLKELWKLIFSTSANNIILYDGWDGRVYGVFEHDVLGRRAWKRWGEIEPLLDDFARGIGLEYRGMIREFNSKKARGGFRGSRADIWESIEDKLGPELMTVGKGKEKGLLNERADNLRVKVGMGEKIKSAFGRYRLWESKIDSVFGEFGVPPELGLVGVFESEMLDRVSKKGAGGYMQIMPATAKEINKALRRRYGREFNPRKLPDALYMTAQLFSGLNREIKSWPLAIIAYNHGPGSVKKAIKIYGYNLDRILQEYGKLNKDFGPDSRGYYPKFLAVLDLWGNWREKFADVKLIGDDAFGYKEYVVRPGDSLWGIANRFGVSVAALKSANHGLGGSRIHPGDKLNVPKAE